MKRPNKLERVRRSLRKIALRPAAKPCGGCGEAKGPSGYYRSNSSKDGLSNLCKNCNDKYTRNWRERTGTYYRDTSRLRQRARHGAPLLTLKDEQDCMDLQNGRCAICDLILEKGKASHLDHDRATGLVRGYLCWRCNLGLGMFRHQTHVLAKAEVYLRHGGVLQPLERTG